MTEDFAWYKNIAIWCGFTAWMVAQTFKMIQIVHRERKVDFAALLSTGGMPSAHSASVCGLATSIGLQTGFSSPLFGVALGFACVVMFDAQSVRLAAGRQARVLNQIVDSLFKEHHLPQQKLRELLGHTRVEVFAGMATGICTALVIHVWA